MNDENENGESAAVINFPTSKIMRILPDPEGVNPAFEEEAKRALASLSIEEVQQRIYDKREELCREAARNRLGPDVMAHIDRIKQSFDWLLVHNIEMADTVACWAVTNIDETIRKMYLSTKENDEDYTE